MFKVILLVFICLFVIIKLFSLYGLKYSNPYKIKYFIGLRGKGKTTLATKLAMQHLKQGHEVYANFELFGAHKIDPLTQFGFYNLPPNSALFLDEVSLIFSNRDFKSFKKEYEEYFRLSRKRQVYIYLLSQSFDTDKKIRDLVDDMYILDSFLNVFSIAKKVRRKLVLHQAAFDEETGQSKGEGFLSEDFSYTFITDWYFTFIPRWVKFFNSFEAPYLPPIKRESYKFKNEPYLHKLKYNSYYILDLATDSKNKLKHKKSQAKQSLNLDFYTVSTPLIKFPAKTYKYYLSSNSLPNQY